MNRINMCRLLRRLNTKWFDSFLSEIAFEQERHEHQVKEIVQRYDDDSYMEADNG